MPTFPRQATKMGLLGGMPSLRVHVVSQSPLCSIFTVKGLKKICPPHLHVVSSNEDKGAFCDFYGPKNREIWGDQRGDQERGLETPVGYRVYYEVLGDFSCYDFLVGFICLFCFFSCTNGSTEKVGWWKGMKSYPLRSTKGVWNGPWNKNARIPHREMKLKKMKNLYSSAGAHGLHSRWRADNDDAWRRRCRCLKSGEMGRWTKV